MKVTKVMKLQARSIQEKEVVVSEVSRRALMRKGKQKPPRPVPAQRMMSAMWKNAFQQDRARRKKVTSDGRRKGRKKGERTRDAPLMIRPPAIPRRS
jgi:hypothetical protein